MDTPLSSVCTLGMYARKLPMPRARAGGMAHDDDLRARHRSRDPHPASYAHEDVLRLRTVLRRSSQYPHLPRLSRPPRRVAGGQRARDPLRPDDRHGGRLEARAALDLPPQELLLSRPAQGLPDLPVRRAPVPGRATGGGAHPPRAPGGRRRQARPCRRQRSHPRLRRVDRRLQPRWHPAGGDRHRARPALGRAGGGVAAAVAHDDAPARRLGREHGGGLAALRRQHLAASSRARASWARRPS